MTIWAIADIHASRRDPRTGQPLKPMDVFGERWADHVDRLEHAWAQRVNSNDTVVVAGDIDWALHLEGAMDTLHRLAGWNGRKILVRGNHDHWWSSKTTNKVRAVLPPGMCLLHNNAYVADGYNICGAKGSPVPGSAEWTPQEEKLLNREVQRLQTSLAARDPALPTIVALHYPPFYAGQQPSAYRALLETDGIVCCVYGHLHGDAAGTGPNGALGGVHYQLVAGDATDFMPVPLADSRGDDEACWPIGGTCGSADRRASARVTLAGKDDR